MQKAETPAEIKGFEEEVKSRRGLCFIFQLEVWMETCDKGLERAEEGKWKFSKTHTGMVQSKHLRIPRLAPQTIHTGAERTNKPEVSLG